MRKKRSGIEIKTGSVIKPAILELERKKLILETGLVIVKEAIKYLQEIKNMEMEFEYLVEDVFFGKPPETEGNKRKNV